MAKARSRLSLVSHRKLRNSEILSEGEQRALALAGFLAELKELGGTHGIIVDDPVSSLDHNRMEAVAIRLVREASVGRQVIIFTHNLAFHSTVIAHAVEARVPVRTEWITRKGMDQFGIIDDQQKPWVSLPVFQRITVLRNRISSLTGKYDQNDEKNRPMVVAIYSMMRETWERLVEEILFNEVVVRFRPDVRTLRLRAAHFDEQDYESVYRGMTRCSRYSGHDRPTEMPPQLPKLVNVLQELSELELYAQRTNKRRKELGEKWKDTEKVPLSGRIL